MYFRATMRTDVGVVRERNEDFAYMDPAGRFVVLADGMGGHGAGDVASEMAVDVVKTILERFELSRATRRQIEGMLVRACSLANDAVLARSQREPELHGMGTTLEVVVLRGAEAFVAHVGDSRTYHVRDGKARQVTADHTVAETMRRAGTLSDDEARTSPLRSMLSNAIGVTPGVMIDQAHVRLEPGDRLLICSDGLYDYFADDELAERSLDELIDEAKARGGHDNLTGVLLEAQRAPVELPFGEESEDALGAIVEAVLREVSRSNPVRLGID
jgi:protein phosphatase